MDNLWAYEYIMYLMGTVEMIYFFYKLMPTKINKVKDEIIYSIILILAYSIIPSIIISTWGINYFRSKHFINGNCRSFCSIFYI